MSIPVCRQAIRAMTGRAIRGTAELAAKLTKSVANDSGLLDDKWGDVVSRSADFVEQQADADPHASTKERAKPAGRCINIIGGCILCCWMQLLENLVPWWYYVVKSFSTLAAIGAAGVTGAALDAMSQFVPDEIGQGNGHLAA